ncbi:MAG: hypothetical protein AAB817_01690 [Patescibacteria group bacterium]
MLSRFPKIFWLVLAVVTISLIGLVWWRLTPPPVNILPATATAPVIDQARLAVEYQQAVDQLVTAYDVRAQVTPLTNDLADVERTAWIAAISVSLDQLLDQRIPAQYRDIHLALAIKLDQVRSALAIGVSDQEFEVRLAQLNSVIANRPWLATTQ